MEDIKKSESLVEFVKAVTLRMTSQAVNRGRLYRNLSNDSPMKGSHQK